SGARLARHVPLERDGRPRLVAAHGDDAVFVAPGEQPVEGHREAAFTSTGEMSVRDADQGATQRRVELSFAAELGGEPEVLRAAARLANSPPAPPVQREPIDVDDGFVAEIAGAEADARVQVEPIAARTDHGRAPPSLGATGEEPVERVSECIGISDRVAGRETGAVHVP